MAPNFLQQKLILTTWRLPVRLIGWLLLVLVMLGWTLGEVEPTSTLSDAQGGSNWRHTRDGWEQAGSWATARPAGRPKPHPVVVGLMQLLLSVTALVALPVDGAGKMGRESL